MELVKKKKASTRLLLQIPAGTLSDCLLETSTEPDRLRRAKSTLDIIDDIGDDWWRCDFQAEKGKVTRTS